MLDHEQEHTQESAALSPGIDLGAAEARLDPEQNRQSLLDSFVSHRKRLWRFIGRLVRPDEIEDIVQETFVQSYTAAGSQHIHNPQAFMYRTARNLALNSLNRSERKLSLSMEEIEETDLVAGTDQVEHQCQSDEQFRTFCRAVAALPVACRKVFILKKVYGLSQKEIAEMLDIASSTVEKHIARGMSATASFMVRAGHGQIVGRHSGKRTGTGKEQQQ